MGYPDNYVNDDDDDCCMIIGVCEEISWQKGRVHRGQPSTRDPNMSARYQTNLGRGPLTQKIWWKRKQGRYQIKTCLLFFSFSVQLILSQVRCTLRLFYLSGSFELLIWLHLMIKFNTLQTTLLSLMRHMTMTMIWWRWYDGDEDDNDIVKMIWWWWRWRWLWGRGVGEEGEEEEEDDDDDAEKEDGARSAHCWVFMLRCWFQRVEKACRIKFKYPGRSARDQIQIQIRVQIQIQMQDQIQVHRKKR